MAKKGKIYKDLIGLGQRLKKLRMASKMTQKEAGLIVEVSEGAVRSWEDGRVEPPLSYLTYWIETGAADPYWLLFGDG